MTFNKKHKIVLGILAGFLLLLLILNVIITRIISYEVIRILENQHVENVRISIHKTKFNLFDRSLVFKGFELSPTEDSMTRFKDNSLNINSIQTVSISRLKFKGIHLTTLMISRRLVINRLILDDPLIQHFTNNTEKSTKPKEKPILLDSIYIKGLRGLQLDVISVSNMKIQVIDAEKNSVTFQNKPLNFEFTGLKLDEVAKNTFKLSPLKEVFEVRKLNMEFPNSKYDLSIEGLIYHYKEDRLQVSSLKYKPMVNKLTLANSYIYNYDVYDLYIQEINVFHPQLEKIMRNRGFFADSISIGNLSLTVFKDKRKPFDLKRRPKLPQQALKQMKTPVLIKKITLTNSSLTYEENLENKDFPMKVTMNHLTANLFNVTSIKEYRESPLKIDANAQFMGKANLNFDMILPLDDDENTFFFSGYLSKSKLDSYESAILPALGLKVLEGEIDSLKFQASANNFNATGTMQFAYKDLMAEVYRQKDDEKSNLLSWSVNNLLHKSNPGPNGEFREAIMKFERVEYKGFGNYLWKTLQSGILNSIIPFGKTSDKVDAKKKRQLKRAERRKKRKE